MHAFDMLMTVIGLEIFGAANLMSKCFMPDLLA